MSKQSVGNGIVVKDGRWVMLCGNTDQPIRLLDAQNREIEPEIKAAESTTSDSADPAGHHSPGANNAKRIISQSTR